jgi:hypothetical protein
MYYFVKIKGLCCDEEIQFVERLLHLITVQARYDRQNKYPTRNTTKPAISK